MPRTSHRRGSAAVATLAVLTLSACTGGGAPTGAPQSSSGAAPDSAGYVFAIPQDFQGVDRAKYSSEAAKIIGDIMHSRLLELEMDGSTPTSCLADVPTRVRKDSPLVESWQPTADGKGLRLVLRKDVKSPQGNTLTSADVKWSIDRIKAIDDSAQTLWFKVGGFDPKNTVTIAGPHELTLNLVKPTVLAPYVLAGNAGLIVDSTAAKANATPDDPWATKYLTSKTANFGPWDLTRFSSQQLVFEPNKNYTGERGNLNRVTVQTVSDPSSRIQLIQSGKVAETNGLDYTQLEQLKSAPNLNLVTCANPARDWLGLNVSDPVLGKPEVRRAISLALDRKAIAEAVYRGFATPAGHGLSAAYKVSEGSSSYARNLDEARALLAKAGVKQGWGFQLSVSAAQPGPYSQNLAALVQQQLAEVGLKVSIRNVPSAVQFRSEGRKKSMQAWLMGETPAFANAGYSGWLTAGCAGLQNYMGYCNQKLDALTTELMAASNDRSAKATEELSALIDAEQPAVYLMDRPTISVRNKCVDSVPSSAFTFDLVGAVSRCT